MSEQEKGMRLKSVIDGLCEDLERCRKRLADVEASEERLAEIVRRSLGLKVFLFENSKHVADYYYMDARAALEKRPLP